MINTEDKFSKQGNPGPESRIGDRLKRRLAWIGRSMFRFRLRLEIGIGVTAVVAPLVRPTIAKKPSESRLKAAGLCLVLTGLGFRAWAAGFTGRHSSMIEGSKLAIAGPYAHVRNPTYLGSVVPGCGMVPLIGDWRLWAHCALLSWRSTRIDSVLLRPKGRVIMVEVKGRYPCSTWLLQSVLKLCIAPSP
jgi:hypothetical protein